MIDEKSNSQKMRIANSDKLLLNVLTLLVAQSNPKEKDIIIDLIMNFLLD